MCTVYCNQDIKITHPLGRFFFRPEFLQNKGATHHDNDGFGKALTTSRCFHRRMHRSALAPSPHYRESQSPNLFEGTSMCVLSRVVYGRNEHTTSRADVPPQRPALLLVADAVIVLRARHFPPLTAPTGLIVSGGVFFRASGRKPRTWYIPGELCVPGTFFLTSAVYVIYPA